MSIKKEFIEPFALATERAAYGAFLLKGMNDKIAADKAAVDEMRKQLNKIKMKGNIVIGEGEMDEAPMLYIDEKVGTNEGVETPFEGLPIVAETPRQAPSAPSAEDPFSKLPKELKELIEAL